VEDEDLIREWIADGLRTAGYAVRTVAMAEQALPLLRANGVDLIVLDLGMPAGTMQGMELLARLRESDEWKRLPVVILSGYGDLVNRDITDRLGVSAVLSKPLRDIEELIVVVRRVLG
jgi:DNA-binding response OmpR family regulator